MLEWFDEPPPGGLLRTAPEAPRACRTAFFSRSTVFRWTDWKAVRAAVNSSTSRSRWIFRWRSLQLISSFSRFVVSVMSRWVYVRIWWLRGVGGTHFINKYHDENINVKILTVAASARGNPVPFRTDSPSVASMKLKQNNTVVRKGPTWQKKVSLPFCRIF